MSFNRKHIQLDGTQTFINLGALRAIFVLLPFSETALQQKACAVLLRSFACSDRKGIIAISSTAVCTDSGRYETSAVHLCMLWLPAGAARFRSAAELLGRKPAQLPAGPPLADLAVRPAGQVAARSPPLHARAVHAHARRHRAAAHILARTIVRCLGVQLSIQHAVVPFGLNVHAESCRRFDCDRESRHECRHDMRLPAGTVPKDRATAVLTLSSMLWPNQWRRPLL